MNSNVVNRRCWWLWLGIVLVTAGGAAFGRPPQSANERPDPAAAAELAALNLEYIEACDTFSDALLEIGDDRSEYDRIVEEYYPDVALFSPRFLKLATKYRGSIEGRLALKWILENDTDRTRREQTFPEFVRSYIEDPELGEICVLAGDGQGRAVEEFMVAVIDANPHRSVQGIAILTLAELLTQKGELVARALEDPQVRAKLEMEEGPEYLALDPKVLRDLARSRFETVINDYADQTNAWGESLAVAAARACFEMDHLLIGMTTPEIEGEDVDGVEFKLSDYRGKVILLAFWRHSGGPCREMYPHERSLVKKYTNAPFVILGVNSDDSRDELKQVMVDEEITWRSWFDGGLDGPIAARWNIDAWPTTFLIDADGVIRCKDVYNDSLDAAIDELLAEMTPN